MKLTKLVLFPLLFALSSYGQYVNRGKEYIEVLASDSLQGRGYQHSGHELAGAFIEQHFIGLGLVPLFGTSFKQELSFTPNSFNGANYLVLNGKSLIDGEEYLFEQNSASVALKGKVKYNALASVYSSKRFVVIDGDQVKANMYKIIDSAWSKRRRPVLVLYNKLPAWGIGFGQRKLPIVFIKRSVLVNGVNDISARVNNIPITVNSNNIGALIKGSSTQDTTIVVCGHYDHLGKFGNAVFNGANDNASGIAAVLCLADTLSQLSSKYNIAFVAFTGEEAGLLGSQYFVHGIEKLQFGHIKFVINLDLMGTGDKGITVVNAPAHIEEYNYLVKRNIEKEYLTKVVKRNNTQNSDHYYFTLKGIPAFFIYAMGDYYFYHDVYDRPEVLTLSAFDQTTSLLFDFINYLNTN
jgi:aminopeptidase YwaD